MSSYLEKFDLPTDKDGYIYLEVVINNYDNHPGRLSIFFNGRYMIQNNFGSYHLTDSLMNDKQIKIFEFDNDQDVTVKLLKLILGDDFEKTASEAYFDCFNLQIEKFFGDRNVRGYHYFLVKKIEEKFFPVSLFTYNTYNNLNFRTLENIFNVCTHPDHRRKKLSFRLLNWFINYAPAVQRDYRYANGILGLDVRIDNPNAQKLYGKLGFKERNRDDLKIYMKLEVNAFSKRNLEVICEKDDKKESFTVSREEFYIIRYKNFEVFENIAYKFSYLNVKDKVKIEGFSKSLVVKTLNEKTKTPSEEGDEFLEELLSL